MEETEARLIEELPKVCRDYCSISWAQALNAAGVPVDSTMRLPENVFFPPEIREVPTDAPKASEQPAAIPDAIPLVEITGGFEDAEEEKGEGKGKGKKPSSKDKDLSKETVTKVEGHGASPKVKDVPPPQPEQKEDPPTKA